MRRYELSDTQWEQIEDLFPSSPHSRGRPRREDRLLLHAIFWILCSGAAWRVSIVQMETRTQNRASARTQNRATLSWKHARKREPLGGRNTHVKGSHPTPLSLNTQPI